MAEHLTVNQRVAGSSPAGGAISFRRKKEGGLLRGLLCGPRFSTKVPWRCPIPIDDRDDRKMAYGLAKDILRKTNATAEEIEYAISLLPISGHKAIALRARLKR